MNHQTIPITPTYSMNPESTTITRIVVAPNYDADTNPWVGYDAICLWFKAVRRWPVRTLSVSIGLTWISIFGVCFAWNALISRQQVAKSPDLFNPAQVGWAVGGGLGYQTVNYANGALTPTLASWGGGGRQLTNAELRRTQRSDVLQTVPVSNNR
jgi:hypothetical protein